jgi:hypothetical protein
VFVLRRVDSLGDPLLLHWLADVESSPLRAHPTLLLLTLELGGGDRDRPVTAGQDDEAASCSERVLRFKQINCKKTTYSIFNLKLISKKKRKKSQINIIT